MVKVDFVEIYVLTFKPEIGERLMTSSHKKSNHDEPDWESMGLPNPNRNESSNGDFKPEINPANTMWRRRLIKPECIMEMSEIFLKGMSLFATEIILDDGEDIMIAGRLTDFEKLLQIEKVTFRPENVIEIE